MSLQGETTARRIRSQAMAMSRTVAQDVDRRVHEAVWEDNADVLEGYEYQYTAALDSRTCEQCAPLMDGGTRRGKRHRPRSTSTVAVVWWLWTRRMSSGTTNAATRRNCLRRSRRITALRYRSSKVRNGERRVMPAITSQGEVNGTYYYNEVREFEGKYADRFNLRDSEPATRLEVFGSRTTKFFEDELRRRPKADPADILSEMLTRPSGHTLRTAVEERSS